MEYFPLFTIGCLYEVNKVKLGTRDWFWVIDIEKENNLLKLVCVKEGNFKEGNVKNLSEAILNYCNNPKTEIKNISSNECNRNNDEYLNCKYFYFPFFHSEPLVIKMIKKGITIENLKTMIIVDEKTFDFIRLTKTIERIKEIRGLN